MAAIDFDQTDLRLGTILNAPASDLRERADSLTAISLCLEGCMRLLRKEPHEHVEIEGILTLAIDQSAKAQAAYDALGLCDIEQVSSFNGALAD